MLYLAAALVVCLTGYTSAQYYNNQPQRGYPAPPPQQQQQQQQGQRNSEAWRRWYYQQRQQQQQQQQQPAYSSPRARQPAPLASPAANSQSNYYNQRQPGSYAAPSSSQYSQQYYQQRPPAPGAYSQQQQQQPYNYQQPNYRPPPPPITPAPPTTPAAPPVEVEFEMPEVPTTTTTRRPVANYQWGQYSQNSGSSQYSNQYQPGQSGSYQPGQYQQPAPQPQPGGYSNSYYQPAPQQPGTQPQQPSQPSQPQQSQPQPQQQQYAQSGWTQPQQQSSYGAQSPQPAADPTDPFSTKFDMNSLKPTVFNSQFQNQPPQQASSPQSGGEFAGLFGVQVTQRQNPNAPPGKVDYGSKGPNPIQLNQFLAQPTSPKDTNAIDALLGSLLSGTVAAQNGQQALIRSIPNITTRVPPSAPASSLVSDRLNGFVLGPRSEYRSNLFSEIPVNNAGYDSVNPLAGFMGETPPPPVTTTPVPPGRNGDFLEGFIGVNKAFEPPKPARDNFQPNIYVYNPMNDAAPPVRTPPPPRPPPTAARDQALNNMGTQELASMVEKLLGALAVKQGAGQG